MLVLTRKLDESIRIGDDIKITILRVKGNTVRIGIEAPREVRVVRDELETADSAAATARGCEPAQSTAMTCATASAPAGGDAKPRKPRVSAAQFELHAGEAMIANEDGAVIATVVDSPEPSTSRLFVGKVRVEAAKNRLHDSHGGDQAAPLRAFLRSNHKLQAAG